MASSYPQVVLFGDSLFQRASEILPVCGSDEEKRPEGPTSRRGYSFQADLQSTCIRRFDVVNRGFSGYNTRQGLHILPKIFQERCDSGPKLEYLLVLLGANDAALPCDPDNQHIDLAEYKVNLKKIIHHPNITAHQPIILLVTPPPLNENRTEDNDKQKGHKHSVRQARITKQYADAAREIAIEAQDEHKSNPDAPDVRLVDLWKAVMDVALKKTPEFDPGNGDVILGELGDRLYGGYLDTLLPDGLHLGGEGYQIFFDLVRPHIIGLVEEKWPFPDWRKMKVPEFGHQETLKK